MRRLLSLALLAGCATASTEQPNTGTDAGGDASSADAAPDAPEPCTEIVTELLANPTFDGTPMGTGWMQTLIDPMYPIITDQDGIVEQSAPYKAWLGGLLSGTDILAQQLTVPARTRLLILTGFYEVRTGEAGGTVLDTGALTFTQTSGAPIATVISLDNTKATTTWTSINYAVSNAETLSGMTIQVRATSSNNASNPTSFYFDTLSVKATHCMP